MTETPSLMHKEEQTTELPGKSIYAPQLEEKPVNEIRQKSYLEDPNTLAVRWKLWKRSFNLYFVAKGITKDEQKTALLLHTGGLNFQELSYTLLTGTDKKPFAESMELLDNYFAPQLNVPYERHQFRQMEQSSGESVHQFVCRLRQKAIFCEFENVDEGIRD
ncbi:unnamed protein product [Porites evermanni]|uniref:Retrotransposon gag domain-containing protein n=1 Tax=Porites evermanni TaxID=104178 RepID=A0ABN8Q5D7_9CNID|nr:unnamed protein product [Porites evermanni]